MSPPARVSIRQVAERAGVSRMTVSNVMLGRNGRVSPETLERVLGAARDLEYAPVPQPTIHSRHIETHTLGLVVDHIVVEDRWGLPTYHGMLESARSSNYDLLTLLRAPADWMLDSQELHFLDRRSDGLIFLVPRQRTRVLETLVRHRIPAVACYVDDVPKGVATVVLDNIGGMKCATQYLIERGHKKILHVAGIEERADFRARRQSYERTMRAARLQPQSVQLLHAHDVSWHGEVGKLLANRAITAIVCAADHYAVEVLDLAKKLKLSAPRDFSIISMDDIPEAAPLGLTSLHYSCAEVGRCAVEAIVNMIGGKDYQTCSHLLPVTLVERSSVASIQSSP